MKIIIGHGNLDFAKQVMPQIPDVELEFVDDPIELARRCSAATYDIAVTSLDYAPSGGEGMAVLEVLKGTLTRRVLWSAAVRNAALRQRALELGADVLDLPEIGSLVGLAVSEAPLKNDGLVLVYVTELIAPPNKRLAEMVKKLFNLDEVVVATALGQELATGRYGLVVDTSTLEITENGRPRHHGQVARELATLRLACVPHVVCMHAPRSLIVDLARAISRFLANQGKIELLG